MHSGWDATRKRHGRFPNWRGQPPRVAATSAVRQTRTVLRTHCARAVAVPKFRIGAEELARGRASARRERVLASARLRRVHLVIRVAVEISAAAAAEGRGEGGHCACELREADHVGVVAHPQRLRKQGHVVLLAPCREIIAW